MANLPSFSTWHFLKEKESKLSQTMINTLKRCHSIEVKEPEKIYGPIDVQGSFNGLLNRGLLMTTRGNDKRKKLSWKISAAGMAVIKLIANDDAR